MIFIESEARYHGESARVASMRCVEFIDLEPLTIDVPSGVAEHNEDSGKGERDPDGVERKAKPLRRTIIE
jgi:hypothetical protein